MAKTSLSKVSKNYRIGAIITGILGALLYIGPLGYYIITGFINGEPQEKFTLGFTVMIALILILVNLVSKLNLRCGLWVILLGLYFVMDNVTTLLIILAITAIVDELLVTPLYKFYKNRYVINKQIDRRI